MRSIFFALGAICLCFKPTLAAINDLPTLGDASSGLVSLDKEFRLGRIWLQNLRKQAAIIHDPLLTEYTENLIYRLASNSEIKDHRLEIVLIDSPQLNAFAVPGGIIGINAGLFLYARDESQFAAVIAHELAHLSQRHFARQVEESKKQAPIALATLLGSIALLVTNNTEAGFAGLMTSQAAATQRALSYSRDWEREADRLGMHTLVKSGFDPAGMPNMFTQMYSAHRYSEIPPEFLLTHPVTESRISDAAARVDAMKSKTIKQPNIEYRLVRTSLQHEYQPASHNISYFKDQLTHAKEADNITLAHYALAKAYLKQENYDRAIEHTKVLYDKDKSSISFIILHSEALYAFKSKKVALKILQDQLALTPDNYPLTMQYSKLLMKERRYQDAATQLGRQALLRATDPFVWQKLSEAKGKLGHQVGQHQASAEFFFLTGYKKKALKQLEFALEKSKDHYLTAARIRQRAKEISSTKQTLDL